MMAKDEELNQEIYKKLMTADDIEFAQAVGYLQVLAITSELFNANKLIRGDSA